MSKEPTSWRVDPDLEKPAAELLKAAHEYFDAMRSKGLAGGCIWLTDQSGAMVVFTRGEHREKLLRNIEMEMDTKRAFQFGVADASGE